MQLHTLLCVIDVKVAYIINKPTLVGELTENVGLMAHVTILFIHNSSSINT